MKELVGLSQSLMSANREAFELGYYETAYHALAAAVHAARCMQDVDLLRSLLDVAQSQAQKIDQEGGPVSTAAAAARGTDSIFTSLQATIDAMIVALEAQRVVEKHAEGSRPNRTTS